MSLKLWLGLVREKGDTIGVARLGVGLFSASLVDSQLKRAMFGTAKLCRLTGVAVESSTKGFEICKSDGRSVACRWSLAKPVDSRDHQ